MAANPNSAGPLLLPEIGPDGLALESPVIAYTEKKIEEEQLQLRKYIKENYSKIRDVERELGNLTLEMKLTAGPKKAALELMRKKIEMSTERLRVAKQNEEKAKKAWEAAAKAVQEEEATKQKLSDDLNNLVKESMNSQFSRLEELKRRVEALNSSRSSTCVLPDGNQTPALISVIQDSSSVVSSTSETANGTAGDVIKEGTAENSTVKGQNQQPCVDKEGKGKKKNTIHGKVRLIGAVPKGRSTATPGWTGAGFDVDGRS